jgi:hypothetical protein
MNDDDLALAKTIAPEIELAATIAAAGDTQPHARDGHEGSDAKEPGINLYVRFTFPACPGA